MLHIPTAEEFTAIFYGNSSSEVTKESTKKEENVEARSRRPSMLERSRRQSEDDIDDSKLGAKNDSEETCSQGKNWGDAGKHSECDECPEDKFGKCADAKAKEPKKEETPVVAKRRRI
jgi:hypothetical protein